MPAAQLLVDEQADGIVILRLYHPPMNTLSSAMLNELAAAAESLAGRADLHAVVVAGGERVFAAGADVTEFAGPDEARAIGARFRAALDAVAAIPRPVIAAIRGFALGGGLELAMACDLRVAAVSARLGQPEILLGIIPGGGGTQRLPRLVGPARAKDLVWTGRQVRAAEALRIGLVDRVVEAEEVDAAALEWARSLGRGAVVAMGLAKHAIDAGLGRELAAGLTLEADAFVNVFRTDDAQAGVRSFLEQGPGRATFEGR